VLRVQALDELSHLLYPFLQRPGAVAAPRFVDELPGHDGRVVRAVRARGIREPEHGSNVTPRDNEYDAVQKRGRERLFQVTRV